MTEDEARKVFQVLTNADGGCGVCVEDLCNRAAIVFPEFPWLRWYHEYKEKEWRL